MKIFLRLLILTLLFNTLLINAKIYIQNLTDHNIVLVGFEKKTNESFIKELWLKESIEIHENISYVFIQNELKTIDENKFKLDQFEELKINICNTTGHAITYSIWGKTIGSFPDNILNNDETITLSNNIGCYLFIKK